jgi:hypothetical protein
MATPDLTKLKHALVNAPLHFYYEVTADGAEVLRHIRVQQRKFDVPADGVTIDVVPPDSIGTEQIEDDSVQLQDLSPEAREAMENNFATDSDVKTVLGL